MKSKRANLERASTGHFTRQIAEQKVHVSLLTFDKPNLENGDIFESNDDHRPIGTSAAPNTESSHTVICEASSVRALQSALAQGADKVRVDVDAFLLDRPTLRQLRRYLVCNDDVERRVLLDRVLASVRAQAEDVMRNAGRVPMRFAIGNRPPSAYFPRSDLQLERVADELGQPFEVLRARVEFLGRGHSKLGLRGCRWALADPALFAALGRAIFEAAANLAAKGEERGDLEILIPAVSLPAEFTIVRDLLAQQAKSAAAEFETMLSPIYGAGIESAAGALSAAELSVAASFFEYDLHELTETLYGLSRDDARAFLPKLLQTGAYRVDPFVSLSDEGASKIVRFAQSIAGDAPNTFPSSVRGDSALSPSGFALAAGAGVREIVVDIEKTQRARQEYAEAFETMRTESSPPGSSSMTGLSGVAPRTSAELPAQDVSSLESLEHVLAEVRAGRLSTEDALLRVSPSIVDSLERPVLSVAPHVPPLLTALGVSPGCGVGRIALSVEKAVDYQQRGEPFVLIVNEVHSEHVAAVRNSQALLSVEGGRTSHSAVVAANCGIPCVVADKVRIRSAEGTVLIGGMQLREGDWLALDGTTGTVYAGKVDKKAPLASHAWVELMRLVDSHRRMQVSANADTPEEVAAAFRNGADAIGLVRTEHMFFDSARLSALQAVLLATTESCKEEMVLLEEAQYADFVRMLSSAGDKSITFRLLDPPLSEFLPRDARALRAVADRLNVSPANVAERVNRLQESDSMLGLRGVRLGATRPDLEATQIRALARAYIAVRSGGRSVAPLHVMVPMVNTGGEIAAARRRIECSILDVEQQCGFKIPFEVGAMIETPSAALEAHSIAQHATFFSYGTNDLTQLTLGCGRTVAAQIVPSLIAAGAWTLDPTAVLDTHVAALIEHAEAAGRAVYPSLRSSVCGAQATDASSIHTIESLGLDAVSVPSAQLAAARIVAAQAAIRAKRTTPAVASKRE